MKRFVLMLILALAAYTTAQAQSPTPLLQYQDVSVRRGWGAVTGTVDSASFLLKRSTSDGTAAGLLDTLNVIDVGNFQPFLTSGPGTTVYGVARLFVLFNSNNAAGGSGDSLGYQYQVSPDNVHWSNLKTIAWAVVTAGATSVSIPLLLDTDETAGTSPSLHCAKFVRILLAGDAAGKQIIDGVKFGRYVPL